MWIRDGSDTTGTLHSLYGAKCLPGAQRSVLPTREDSHAGRGKREISIRYIVR
jgi:hypothetical protein